MTVVGGTGCFPPIHLHPSPHLPTLSLALWASHCVHSPGDKYQDAAIDTFNKCAVSEKKCVPQRVDEGVYPVPQDCALDTKFNLADFQGRWYITAGLNPLFDTFPCQVRPLAGTAFSLLLLLSHLNSLTRATRFARLPGALLCLAAVKPQRGGR